MMLSRLCVALLLAALMMPSTPGLAAQDDWPCAQRKVSQLSLASVWKGPPPDLKALNWRGDPAISDLVARLAVRRTGLQEASEAIAGLSDKSGAERQAKLLALLAGLLETLDAERNSVMAGLERFGRAQKKFADDLRKENAELSNLRSDTTTDPANLAERTDRLTWNLRIFDERQKSVRFVCEVPSIIEQRLFALSRAIQMAL